MKYDAPTEIDSAYQGAPGQTRAESVHVLAAKGVLQAVEMYRVVNVATHPELREPALEGELHRLEDGRKLSLPFVYHDPDARKFALVIPVELSHLELKERAQVITELAEDNQHQVPAYVRSCVTVIGLEALKAFLASSPYADEAGISLLPLKKQKQQLHARKEALAELERDAAQKEQGLMALVEGIAAREAELREYVHQIDIEKNNLADRIEALEKRIESLQKMPSRIPRERKTSPPPIRRGGEWKEVGAVYPEEVVQAEVVSEEPETAEDSYIAVTAENGDQFVNDNEVQEVRIAAEVRREPTSPAPSRLGTPPPIKKNRSSAPSLTAPRNVFSQMPPQNLDETTESESRTQEYLEPLPPPLLRTQEVNEPINAVDITSAIAAIAGPDLDPPAHFLSSENLQMATALGKEPWLFVRVDKEHANAFGDQSDLLLQYAEVQGYPIAILTLVSGPEEQPYSRKTALDPHDAEDRAFLRALEQLFQARAAIYVGNQYYETRDITAFREKLVSELLEITAAPNENAAISPADACRQALEAPPPQSEQTPFGPPSLKKASLLTVAEAVENMARWTTPINCAARD